MDASPPSLTPHEQLGILAGAFQHDLANHASVLSGLVQLLESTPPPGRDGARLFAELQRGLGRFNEALAEFTRMRRALTQPVPRCAPSAAVAMVRAGLGGVSLAADMAPDVPVLTGDARWFAFLVTTLAEIAGSPPSEATFTARVPDAPASAELRMLFEPSGATALASFTSRPPPAAMSPALAVARVLLLRLDGTAELVPDGTRTVLRLRFRHPRPVLR